MFQHRGTTVREIQNLTDELRHEVAERGENEKFV